MYSFYWDDKRIKDIIKKALKNLNFLNTIHGG